MAATQSNAGSGINFSMSDANMYSKLIEEVSKVLQEGTKTGAAAGVDSKGIGLSYLGERIRLYLAAGNEKTQMLLEKSKNNIPLILGVLAFAVMMIFYLKNKKQ